MTRLFCKTIQVPFKRFNPIKATKQTLLESLLLKFKKPIIEVDEIENTTVRVLPMVAQLKTKTN